MKILFIISVHGHGRGGHFHSLNHISSVLSIDNEIKIISFGPGKSEVLESNSLYISNIYFNGLNFFSLKKQLYEIRQSFNPDIYHCFDIGSYNILRLLISSRKSIIIVNKCGGPNPSNYPFIPNLVLFSDENFEWFKNNLKYQLSNINLIPNRVKSISISPDNYNNNLVNKEVFTFVRISRIGNTYLKSLFDSAHLVNKLSLEKEGGIRLIVIGTVEDQNAYNSFIESDLFKEGNVILITDRESTKEASKMLYLADAVIGTGRGLMESASLSIPILAINSQDIYPVLLNEKNFSHAFRTNFSERNIFPNFNEDDNLLNIKNMVFNKKQYKLSSDFSFLMFKNYFDLEVAKYKYISAYNNSILMKNHVFKDSKFILKSIVLFFLSSFKINKK